MYAQGCPPAKGEQPKAGGQVREGRESAQTNPTGDEPIAIADYRSSQGKNSRTYADSNQGWRNRIRPAALALSSRSTSGRMTSTCTSKSSIPTQTDLKL